MSNDFDLDLSWNDLKEIIQDMDAIEKTDMMLHNEDSIIVAYDTVWEKLTIFTAEYHSFSALQEFTDISAINTNRNLLLCPSDVDDPEFFVLYGELSS